MTDAENRVICRTPTPGKQSTRILQWKYDLVRRAILEILASTNGGVAFKRLPGLVKQHLSAADRERLGSVGWYTTVVKLDLEVRGEIERVPEAKPQRLRLTS